MLVQTCIHDDAILSKPYGQHTNEASRNWNAIIFLSMQYFISDRKMRARNELSGKSLPSSWARDIIRQSVRTGAHTRHTGRVRENHWVLKSVNNKRKMKNIRLVVVGIVLSLLRGPLLLPASAALNVQWEDASALLPARSEWVGALDVA